MYNSYGNGFSHGYSSYNRIEVPMVKGITKPMILV